MSAAGEKPTFPLHLEEGRGGEGRGGEGRGGEGRGGEGRGGEGRGEGEKGYAAILYCMYSAV